MHDIAIVGGGIIGTALADELARRGARVCVIEQGAVGQEASSAAAGILASHMDVPHPGPLFDLCQMARRLYVPWVRSLERRSGVDVAYRACGILYLALSSREAEAMGRQMRWQTARGLRVERWSAVEVRRREPAVDGRLTAGFCFPTEGQIDNVRLMQALRRVCRTRRITVAERTVARRVRIRRGAAAGIDTDHGAIRARAVINCLGSWARLGGRFPVRVPVEPARGQLLAFDAPKRLVRRAVMSSRAYFVQRPDGRLLVGSTIERVGFDKSLTIHGMHAILCGARRMSRALDRCAFLDAWAGLRPDTPDHLPILGATTIGGLYVAAGHFRHGILLAPATARVMADLILRGRSAVDLAPFSPSRFS